MPPASGPTTRKVKSPRERRRGVDRAMPDGSSQISDTGDRNINKPSGTAPLLDQPTVTPNSAFGKQYIGANYPDLYANPDVLATDWMSQNGINAGNAGGQLKVFNDLAAAMPQLFFLTQGAGGDLKNSSYANFLDYAQQFMDLYSTPGGGTISPDAIGNIFNNDPNSGLSKLLNDPSADTGQQINTLMGLLGGGLATSMPGAIASSVMGSAEQLAKEFQAMKYKGGTGTFADYLKSKGFDQQF